jgi:probable selenium-dependent hydroxylase accessory protein YqeC
LLGLADGKSAVIAVIGCGGKTTLIESLANEYRHKKVLVSPTTKIFPMKGEGIVLCTKLDDCLSHKAQKGIQCLGLFDETTGKLKALGMDLLEEIIPHYDLVLLEADGSRGLPCKGWLNAEPPVPPFCTHTLGLVSLSALGKAADGDTVLHLPEFLKLTGLSRGAKINLKALTLMVCAGNGMFSKGRGRQCLFVNQAEDQAAAVAAKEWLRAIQEANPGRFACLAYGSARTNRWSQVPCDHQTL